MNLIHCCILLAALHQYEPAEENENRISVAGPAAAQEIVNYRTRLQRKFSTPHAARRVGGKGTVRA